MPAVCSYSGSPQRGDGYLITSLFLRMPSSVCVFSAGWIWMFLRGSSPLLPPPPR